MSPSPSPSTDDDSFRDQEDVYMPHQKKKRSTLAKVLYYAFAVFLVSGWFVAIDLYRRPRVIDTPGLHSPHPFPPEIFSRVKRVFEPDERYVGPSNMTNQNWDHLVAGHDALYIENPEKYGLMQGIGPSFHHPDMPHPAPKKFYVVSLLHQMHCLNMIRFRYWQVKFPETAIHVPGYTEADWDAHVDHCFEYLRQAISCGSGFTIEGDSPLLVEGEKGKASTVTGWGIEHDCINFEALRTFQIEQETRFNATWQR